MSSPDDAIQHTYGKDQYVQEILHCDILCTVYIGVL